MASLPALLLLATSTLLFTAPLAHSLDVPSPAPVLPLAPVNLTICNNLLDVLNVTIPATHLGSTRTVLIPPSENGTLPVEPQSPVLSTLVLSVRAVAYGLQGDCLLLEIIGRALSETGSANINVSSPCVVGEAYLSGLKLAPSAQVKVASLQIPPVPLGTCCARPLKG